MGAFPAQWNLVVAKSTGVWHCCHEACKVPKSEAGRHICSGKVSALGPVLQPLCHIPGLVLSRMVGGQVSVPSSGCFAGSETRVLF